MLPRTSVMLKVVIHWPRQDSENCTKHILLLVWLEHHFRGKSINDKLQIYIHTCKILPNTYNKTDSSHKVNK